ncbi:unnamed protein product, partial [Mycena citricolor]
TDSTSDISKKGGRTPTIPTRLIHLHSGTASHPDLQLLSTIPGCRLHRSRRLDMWSQSDPELTLSAASCLGATDNGKI